MAYDLRRLGAAVAICGTLAVAAGCTSASTTTTNAQAVNPGADRSTTYPDITARVQAATAQMSDEEAAKISARVSGLGAQRRAGTISEAEYRRQMAEMDALAQNHGADTLNEIQN
ncbi:SHOCT domain-containing protein [Rhizobium sp. TRM96647]|uniref:SHOCT domain-containing protein n=1 Tax=unclassified Rhizobium TaxID=2613769 RepID=UPI001E536E90|nr:MULTISPECIES: SHOCT domain-containing protein [unclassified Rhizobium]MCD2184526.1 SHOCT domain-containing protein [Rhizobium sp. GN54]MCV3737655.1 SHOCT domain-containing protein [Rhizobium sp. TRM96647]MCV3759614.1 SHOCT domain-containing protein [Rhizobium sp. TRM96650]